ncbi:hypothetical protein BH10ACI3_BH10ACI3_09060 [soil metagenome]
MVRIPVIQKRLRWLSLEIESWIVRATKGAKKGHYSNFGEQKIIDKYVKSLNIAEQSKTVVDIGAGNGIRNSNTFGLLEKGWNVLGIDRGSRNAESLTKLYRTFNAGIACHANITPSNVVGLLRSHSIEKDFGVLSLDIDGYDYWVLDAVLSAFRPRLIVSEYNEKIPPPVRFTVNYSSEFTLRHHFFGYSICQLKDLLAKHNYVLLEIEFNNVFLAPAEIKGVVAADVERAYRDGYAARPDRREKFKTNENMEILHNLSPAECVDFLNAFYADHVGEYQIGLE